MNIKKIAEDLIGTANTEPDMENWTQEQHEEFDDIVFNCSNCGWWAAAEEKTYELDGDGVFCQECIDELY